MNLKCGVESCTQISTEILVFMNPNIPDLPVCLFHRDDPWSEESRESDSGDDKYAIFSRVSSTVGKGPWRITRSREDGRIVGIEVWQQNPNGEGWYEYQILRDEKFWST